MQTKSHLRAQIRHARKNLESGQVSERSARIAERLLTLDLLLEKDSFMIYSDFDNEVKTDHIYSVLRDMSKTVYLPAVKGDDIRICPVTEKMRANRFGILEPVDAGIFIKPSEIDVFIVPGICFDRSGGRIGFGRGYYDRLFTEARGDSLKVALAYDFQVVADVCPEDHDIKMDYIITEKEIIRIRS